MTRTAFAISDGCVAFFDWVRNVLLEGKSLDRQKGTAMLSVRRVPTILLLLMVVSQLGSACGFASAASAESWQCCQTRCPSPSSRASTSCCQISATSDKGVPSTSAMPQAPVVRLASTAELFRLHRVSDLSRLAHRSLAPPPQNSFDALCSRQI
jgi:hypothetical protein